MKGIDILIVDDDPEFSGMLRRRLNKDAPHFSIHAVSGGEDCLAYLRGHRTDCVLSDYQMGGMDGMALLAALRDAGDDTPFILLTGQGNEEVARAAFKGGACDYFTKDIGFAHFTRLANSVEQAVNRKRTERMVRKAELALMEERNKLDSVLTCIGDAISIQDREFMVVYQNPAHKSLAGDHAGEYCYKAYSRKDEVCEGCPVAKSFEDGMAHTVQKAGKTEKGPLFVEITASPLRNSSGEIVGGIESVRNITERKRLERERADFYAMLTHDIKSPLTSIIGYSELLSASAACMSDRDVPGMIEGVGKSARRVLDLVEDFLTVSRMESGQLAPDMAYEDVSELMGEVRVEFEPVMRQKALDFRCVVQPGLPSANVDKRLLVRAVCNLVRNAATYTRAGGTITLEAGPSGGGAHSISISVSDTGPGIPYEEQGRIFDIYYRPAGSAGTNGAGIGLATVKAAASAHGGRVELESVPGEGATFRLVIPSGQK